MMRRQPGMMVLQELLLDFHPIFPHFRGRDDAAGVLVLVIVAVLQLVLEAAAATAVLSPLRRRHLGGVTFPPFRSPILEPYLETSYNKIVGLI